MAKKTNSFINGAEYYRIRSKVGISEDGKSIMKNFYGSSKKEAEKMRDEYLFSISQGLTSDYDKLTFSKLFKEWFDEVKKPSVTANTYTRYEATYRLYIKPSSFHSMKINDIKGISIQKLINSLPTPNVAERVHILLNSFFKYCIEEQYIVKNPLLSVKLPKIVKVDKKNFLEREEIKLLSSLGQEDFIFVFAAFTGLRQGEILALTHGDIDFKNDLIYVTKSVKRVTVINGKTRKSETIVKEPKTSKSKRDIPIMKNLVEPLKKQIALEKEKHLALGVKYYKNTALLFSTKNLTHKRGDHVLEEWKKLQDGMFEETVSFHALRHSFCTMLCDKGVPLTVAATLLGHSTTEQVDKIYAHFMKESPKEAISALNSFFSNAQ